MDADRSKTTRGTGDDGITREAGNGRTTKEAADDETRHHRHDGEITEQTKASGTELSATGHRFVAAGRAGLSETEASENDARPRFYLVVRIGIDRGWNGFYRVS